MLQDFNQQLQHCSSISLLGCTNTRAASCCYCFCCTLLTLLLLLLIYSHCASLAQHRQKI
jgi:hypothetical protein